MNFKQMSDKTCDLLLSLHLLYGEGSRAQEG